jgi:Zn-dependent M28 family amino/carboxypeptidase
MLRAHVQFLASDSMAGRLCPSRSCQLTADYVLSQLVGAGLQTQVQTTEATFEVRRGDVVVRPSRIALDPKWLAFDLSAELKDDGTVATNTGIRVPKSAELDPIYKATGPISITIVPAGLRNVIGVVRGRHRTLRDTYVLVTAHYDHIGMKGEHYAQMPATGTGDDSIYNGANDNASGVSALIEIARSVASSPVKPLRSIVFMAYFGEEAGLVGSRYYGSHPVFPLNKTYAQVNFEQLGRTDDTEGPRVKAATVTGWDRSEVGSILAAAGKIRGVRVYKHEKFSELLFERSDNEALAKLGIPAHTVTVAYEFPDYHQLSDSAEKLDYVNFSAVARALRAGIGSLANRRTALPLRPPPPAAN